MTTYKGLDLLALARMDAHMIASLLPRGTAIGCLAGTFGHVGPNLQTLLQTGNISAVRVHLLNGPCYRNRNCEPTEPKLNDLKTLGLRAKEIQAIASQFPHVPFYLSPVLEYDEKNIGPIVQWLTTVKHAAPHCTPSLNPASGIGVSGTLTERHAQGASADIISNDGCPISSLHQYTANLIKFAWLPIFNLRAENDPHWIPPSKRTLQVKPEDIKQALGAL